MMPTMNSKISHDYRFLPDLLMPIVTIDEVHNESSHARNSETNNQRENIKKEDLIDLSQKGDKIDISTTQGHSTTTSQNISDNIEIKTEDATYEDKLPILAVKTENDLTNIDVEKQEFASELKLKVKEEIIDSEENITSNKTEAEDILQSVSRVIQLASSKNEVAKNTALSTETNHYTEVPDIKKMQDLSIPNGPPPQPEKRKRGRPRKTPAEKTLDIKTKGKKTRGRKRKNKKSKKPKKTQLVKVARKDESDLPKYPCPICKDDKMRTEKQLRQHYKSDHGGRRLRTAMLSTEMVPCDVCGKEFKSAYHLKEHMETHNNYYCCEICNSSHRKILDYVIHMRIHSDKGFFKCLFCPYITEEIVEITKHINHSHEEKTSPYVCQICKKSFSLLSWYEEHSNFHSGLKPFSCDVCGKYFMYSRYLFAHKNFMHKELGSYNIHECVICHKQYQHRNSLKLHMNSHTGNFAICDVCGKILSSREKLKFHMRTHTGYKPFDCSYCGKCFTKKPILVEHIRIHTGERPYVCEYCTKAFSQRSSLVIHIRSHTGERPFVCQFCHKGFVAKAMLNIHLKTCKGLIVYE